MLSPKLNKYIEEGGIQSGAFLQIESVNRKTVAGYRSITVTRGVPVGTPGDICGSPTEISLRVGAIVPTDLVVGTTPPSRARTASRTSFRRSSPSKSHATISDGTFALLVMLSPKLNKYIEEGGIQSGAFLQIESVNRKTVAGYRSITVTRGVPVGTPGDICGSPTEISLRVGAIVPTDLTFEPVEEPVRYSLVPKDRADGGYLRSNGGSKQQPSASQPGGEGRSVTIKSITASKAVANGGQPQGRQAYGGLNKNTKVISMHPNAKVSVPNASSNIQASTSTECQPKSSSAATGSSAANGQSPASANAVSTVKTTQHFNLSNFITAAALEHVEPTRIAFSELNAGLRFDWTTYGRIYEISGPHRWKNETKEGIILTLKIVDKDRNKMLLGSFDPVAIERVMAEAVVGKVMKLSNVRVCPVKEEFLQPDILPLQMMLKYNSTFSFPNSVRPSGSKGGHFTDWFLGLARPAMPMQLTGIHLLRGLEFKSRVNVLGVVLHVGQVASFSKKKCVAGEEAEGDDRDDTAERRRLEVQLVDRSLFVVCLTLWDQKADDFKVKRGDVLLLKKVDVVNHGGVSLNAFKFTKLDFEPNISGVTELKDWYSALPEDPALKHVSSGYSASAGLRDGIVPRSSPLSIKDVLESNLGHGARVDTFHLEEAITGFDCQTLYEGCRHPDCNRSLENREHACGIASHAVQSEDDGEKRTKAKEMLKIMAFSPVADEILNEAPEELVKVRDNNEGGYEALLPSKLGTIYKFTIQARTRRWKNVDTGKFYTELQYHVVAAHLKEEDEEEQPVEEVEDEGDGDGEEENAGAKWSYEF
ncbi:hypothetical protein DACRYDRAFT_106464 [Dacryopinax primogenitus]|uniref:Replication protein A OB domain-containing protein n=1 Tax=Dacryopinax primogenitus (strain DJM 731) TaxID=1858805 RepID=M5GEJ0_DACPD|nr:uncharacterized protein DACRYDRAFT_106464 [Dacryopinax primogenitus]EJU03303.1 hypothetical protein DACRYDRAFT_106464 [Dacryopinax primogenitus]